MEGCWTLFVGIGLEALKLLLMNRVVRLLSGTKLALIAIAMMPMLYLAPLAIMASISSKHVLWMAGGLILGKVVYTIYLYRQTQGKDAQPGGK